MRITPLIALAAAGLAAATPAVAQSYQEQQRFDQAQQRFDNEYRIYREAVDRYMSSRDRGGPPPRGYQDNNYRTVPDDRYENGYDASRYYRSGGNYQERVLAPDERVYRGNDGQYYCKRSDGTTGLIVGGAAGGILGNVIDGGHSRTVGTLLGAAVGALAGKAVDQQNSQVRCR
jgi:hypothetical protein